MCVKCLLISLVKSWEGGSNSVDASDLRRRERDREDWDRELDRGKVN